MKSIKSDRLKKFEMELNDLEEWLRLGLVPKKDLDRHKEEIRNLKSKIEEEKERLQFLKEGGEGEEFIAPKRSQQKGGYNEMPTIPDVDAHETGSGLTEGGFDMTSYVTDETSYEDETEEEYYTAAEAEEGVEEEAGVVEEEQDDDEEDESYFSDRNRWKRGGIVDPDADEW